MPMIRVNTNVAPSQEITQAVLSDLSHLANTQLNKPEQYVMVHMCVDQNMRFAGTDAPLAFVEVKSIGLQTAQNVGMSKALAECLNKRLGIDPARLYIEFTAVQGSWWGWNGDTF